MEHRSLKRKSLKQELMNLQQYELERARTWLYFVLFCGLIIFLSHQPGDPTHIPLFPHFDKVIHFIEYFVFGVLLQRALAAQTILSLEESYNRLIFVVLSVTALFAASDEIHQYFVPFRTMSIWDWLTDLVGAGFSIVVFQATRPNSKRFDL